VVRIASGVEQALDVHRPQPEAVEERPHGARAASGEESRDDPQRREGPQRPSTRVGSGTFSKS
jgi:hypothetical protein